VAESENRAQLRVNASQFGGFNSLSVLFNHDDLCKKQSKIGHLTFVNSTKSDVGTDIPMLPNLIEGRYFDRFISAGKDVNITVASIGGLYECNVGIKFKPKVGGKYLIDFNWLSDMCVAELKEIHRNTDDVDFVSVPVTKPEKTCPIPAI
jgi:hypothetical protein